MIKEEKILLSMGKIAQVESQACSTRTTLSPVQGQPSNNLRSMQAFNVKQFTGKPSDIKKLLPKKKGDANDALCVMFAENIGTPERHAGIHGKSIFSQNHVMT